VVQPPAQTSTPSPVPTPAPVPGPLAAGASAGSSISGPYACAAATLTFVDRPNPNPGITSLVALGQGQVFDLLTVQLPRADEYQYGFVPTVFAPADKIVSETGVYDQFVTDGELNIYRNQGPVRPDWATLGLVSNRADGSLCTFALGLPVSDRPASGARTYNGMADGIALVGGEVRRLFGSPAALTVDYASGTGTLRLDLSGRTDAFGNFVASQATPTATVTGNLSSSGGGFTGNLQSASGGFSGSVWGNLFGPQARGAGVAFALSDGAGNRIIGSAALAPN
jgi:hypothetical protein